MDSSSSTPSFSRSRRWFIGFHVILAVVAMMAIVAMANYLSVRHFVRKNLQGDGRDKLTPATLQVLQSLTNDMRVIIYFDPEHPMYPYVDEMLKEYANASRFIKLETVKYRTEPTKAALILSEFHLSQDTKDLVIFSSNGKMDYVNQGELSDMDYNDLIQGKSKEVKRRSFLGERFFTSKILSISNAKPSTAYFLIRHGEHDADSDGSMGYKKFKELLLANNVKVNLLDLIRSPEVPADCDLLIVAGPVESMGVAELDKMERYLAQGGRLFFLANFKTKAGPESLLIKWGVNLGNNLVVDEANMTEKGALIYDSFGTHPIMQPIAKNSMVMVLTPPRSVRGITSNQQADSARVTDLISTGPDGQAFSDYRPSTGSYYPSTRDVRGVIPIAVAVEKGGLRKLKLERGTTRLVVCGDSVFLNNEMLMNPGNEEFARQSVNWLLGRSEMVGSIGPRSFTEYVIVLSDSQMNVLRWILLAAIPGGVLAFGLLVYLRRQR